MAEGATAQLNVRLPRELKERGDRGLERLGLTPTQAVRQLWTALSGKEDEQAQARDLLLGGQQATAVSTDDPLLRGWELVATGVQELGISFANSPTETLSDEELLAEALEDRMRTRGMR